MDHANLAMCRWEFAFGVVVPSPPLLEVRQPRCRNPTQNAGPFPPQSYCIQGGGEGGTTTSPLGRTEVVVLNREPHDDLRTLPPLLTRVLSARLLVAKLPKRTQFLIAFAPAERQVTDAVGYGVR